MAKKKKAQSSQRTPKNTSWETPKFAGKKVCFAGRFEKYRFGETRIYLERLVTGEGGEVTDGLNAAVDYLVLKEPTGSSTHEKKVAQLNAKGASITVLAPDQLRSMVEPSQGDVEEMLRAGADGHKRLAETLWALGMDSSSLRYAASSPFSARKLVLKGQQLNDIPLWCVSLDEADLRNCEVTEGNQQGYYVFGCITNSKLDGSKFHANFHGLIDCSCRNADFTGSWLDSPWTGGKRQFGRCKCDFTKSNLKNFHLSHADVSGSIFTNANLTNVDLKESLAKDANFDKACLESVSAKDVNFAGSSFVKADLSKADLLGANFDGCNLAGAKLHNAMLMHASFKGADLTGADFTGANTAQANFENAVLTKVKGLTSGGLGQITIGPKLLELSDTVKSAAAFETSIELDTGSAPVRLKAKVGYRGPHASWSKELWADTLSDWSQNTKSVADAMVAAVGCWPDSTPLPFTVRASGKKVGMVNKKLVQLAREAWCETFGIAAPTESELAQGKQAAEEKKDVMRAELLALLAQPQGVDKWNEKQRTLISEAIKSFPCANLSGKELGGIILSSLEIDQANFEGAALANAELAFASFKQGNFKKAKLDGISAVGTKFEECDFNGANCTGANFRSASFRKADLSKCELVNASLYDADLRGANLQGAKLKDCNLDEAKFDEGTIFPAGWTPPDKMKWKGNGIDPRAKSAIEAVKSAGPIDLAQFMEIIKASVDKERLSKALKMLKAERFRLFAQATDDHLLGVVKSQNDPDLVYSCRLTKEGQFACCTQNLNVCGGLRGALCKHLLVLIIGMVKGEELDPTTVAHWMQASKFKKPELDKDAMSETWLRYKGAEAGEIDWRPTETIPEDYYAL